MRACIILNPWADRGRAAEARPALLSWIEPLDGVDLQMTTHAGHAQELAYAAALGGYDLVIAAGGDGTVNEVVNGLVEAGAGAALGIIPLGSGNDYAYGMGLPMKMPEALQTAFHGRIRAVDVAFIRDNHGRQRVSANGIGIGFDAAVNIESRKITRIHGFPLYLLATLRSLIFRYDTPQCRIRFDDEREVTQRMLLLAVGIGRRVGGGFLLTPEARPDDGLLDSCLVEPVIRPTLLALVFRSMNGKHVTSPHIQMLRSRQISLQSDLPLPIHTDGEIFARPEDDVRELTVSIRSPGINLLSPAQAPAQS